MAGRIFVITGPSGVGKTTVAMKLLEQASYLKKVITCTTRPPREGEVDGVDYRFVKADAFTHMIEAGELFEWAEVYDRFYGSRKEDVQALLSEGFDVLFVIDVQGAKTVQEDHPEAVIIFLEAESPETFLSRIKKRDGDTTFDLEARKAALTEEMDFANRATHIITNKEGKLEETVKEIQKITQDS